MRFFMGLVLVLALGAMGCSETSGTGGAAGDGGSGGGGSGGMTGEKFPCNEAGIRDAIAEGGGPHTFDCGGPGTLVTVVTDTVFEIDKDVILDGEGYLTVSREAGPNDEYEDHEVFGVADGIVAELGGFAVNQISGDEIAGIRNLGTLTLTKSSVLMGVDNPGTLTIMNSNASGISNAGTLTMTNSDSNGISNEGDMVLTRSEVSGGSGITNTGTATLERSTVVENEGWPAGGVLNSGTLTIVDSTIRLNMASCYEFEGCSVAGILNEGTLTVSGSNISDNQLEPDEGEEAPCGASVNRNGTATFTNSILGGEEFCNDEGGELTLSHSLIELLRVGASAMTMLRNSIVTGDCAGDGVITSGGYNVETPGNTCGFDTNKGDLVEVSEEAINLDPGDEYGGPTFTVALVSPSVGIDLVPVENCLDAEGKPLTTDQRGKPRPYGEGCDVGSFEWNPGDPTQE